MRRFAVAGRGKMWSNNDFPEKIPFKIKAACNTSLSTKINQANRFF